MEREEITLHGHTVSYRRGGWGPVIVLIHGITGSSDTCLGSILPLTLEVVVSISGASPVTVTLSCTDEGAS